MAANNIPKLNIVMIGDSGTGKTSLASVFVNGQQSFPEIYITTNGLFASYFIVYFLYTQHAISPLHNNSDLCTVKTNEIHTSCTFLFDSVIPSLA